MGLALQTKEEADDKDIDSRLRNQHEQMEESSSVEEGRAWGKVVGDEVEMKDHKVFSAEGLDFHPESDRSR